MSSLTVTDLNDFPLRIQGAIASIDDNQRDVKLCISRVRGREKIFIQRRRRQQGVIDDIERSIREGVFRRIAFPYTVTQKDESTDEPNTLTGNDLLRRFERQQNTEASYLKFLKKLEDSQHAHSRSPSQPWRPISPNSKPSAHSRVSNSFTGDVSNTNMNNNSTNMNSNIGNAFNTNFHSTSTTAFNITLNAPTSSQQSTYHQIQNSMETANINNDSITWHQPFNSFQSSPKTHQQQPSAPKQNNQSESNKNVHIFTQNVQTNSHNEDYHSFSKRKNFAMSSASLPLHHSSATLNNAANSISDELVLHPLVNIVTPPILNTTDKTNTSLVDKVKLSPDNDTYSFTTLKPLISPRNISLTFPSNTPHSLLLKNNQNTADAESNPFSPTIKPHSPRSPSNALEVFNMLKKGDAHKKLVIPTPIVHFSHPTTTTPASQVQFYISEESSPKSSCKTNLNASPPQKRYSTFEFRPAVLPPPGISPSLHSQSSPSQTSSATACVASLLNIRKSPSPSFAAQKAVSIQQGKDAVDRLLAIDPTWRHLVAEAARRVFIGVALRESSGNIEEERKLKRGMRELWVRKKESAEERRKREHALRIQVGPLVEAQVRKEMSLSTVADLTESTIKEEDNENNNASAFEERVRNIVQFRLDVLAKQEIWDYDHPHAVLAATDFSTMSSTRARLYHQGLSRKQATIGSYKRLLHRRERVAGSHEDELRRWERRSNRRIARQRKYLVVDGRQIHLTDSDLKTSLSSPAPESAGLMTETRNEDWKYMFSNSFSKVSRAIKLKSSLHSFPVAAPVKISRFNTSRSRFKFENGFKINETENLIKEDDKKELHLKQLKNRSNLSMHKGVDDTHYNNTAIDNYEVIDGDIIPIGESSFLHENGDHSLEEIQISSSSKTKKKIKAKESEMDSSEINEDEITVLEGHVSNLPSINVIHSASPVPPSSKRRVNEEVPMLRPSSSTPYSPSSKLSHSFSTRDNNNHNNTKMTTNALVGSNFGFQSTINSNANGNNTINKSQRPNVTRLDRNVVFLQEALSRASTWSVNNPAQGIKKSRAEQSFDFLKDEAGARYGYDLANVLSLKPPGERVFLLPGAVRVSIETDFPLITCSPTLSSNLSSNSNSHKNPTLSISGDINPSKGFLNRQVLLPSNDLLNRRTLPKFKSKVLGYQMPLLPGAPTPLERLMLMRGVYGHSSYSGPLAVFKNIRDTNSRKSIMHSTRKVHESLDELEWIDILESKSLNNNEYYQAKEGKNTVNLTGLNNKFIDSVSHPISKSTKLDLDDKEETDLINTVSTKTIDLARILTARGVAIKDAIADIMKQSKKNPELKGLIQKFSKMINVDAFNSAFHNDVNDINSVRINTKLQNSDAFDLQLRGRKQLGLIIKGLLLLNPDSYLSACDVLIKKVSNYQKKELRLVHKQLLKKRLDEGSSEAEWGQEISLESDYGDLDIGEISGNLEDGAIYSPDGAIYSSPELPSSIRMRSSIKSQEVFEKVFVEGVRKPAGVESHNTLQSRLSHHLKTTPSSRGKNFNSRVDRKKLQHSGDVRKFQAVSTANDLEDKKSIGRNHGLDYDNNNFSLDQNATSNIIPPSIPAYSIRNYHPSIRTKLKFKDNKIIDRTSNVTVDINEKLRNGIDFGNGGVGDEETCFSEINDACKILSDAFHKSNDETTSISSHLLEENAPNVKINHKVSTPTHTVLPPVHNKLSPIMHQNAEDILINSNSNLEDRLGLSDGIKASDNISVSAASFASIIVNRFNSLNPLIFDASANTFKSNFGRRKKRFFSNKAGSSLCSKSPKEEHFNHKDNNNYSEFNTDDDQRKTRSSTRILKEIQLPVNSIDLQSPTNLRNNAISINSSRRNFNSTYTRDGLSPLRSSYDTSGTLDLTGTICEPSKISPVSPPLAFQSLRRLRGIRSFTSTKPSKLSNVEATSPLRLEAFKDGEEKRRHERDSKSIPQRAEAMLELVTVLHTHIESNNRRYLKWRQFRKAKRADEK